MRRRGIWASLIVVAAVVGLGVLIASRSRSNMAEAAAPLTPAPVDGKRALGYLQEICKIGPRPAGSAANARQRAYVAKHFAATGATVREQPFSGTDPRSGSKVEMSNLIGSWYPDRTRRVLLSAHYDTRPFPDEERNPSRRTLPFIGANDGASGVALLMEIANHLKTLPTPWGVDLVLFDGEELVYGHEGEYFLGSKEFAHAYAGGIDSGKSNSRYEAAIVLDMVGGRNLKIKQEPYSLNFEHKLVQEVWSVARRLKSPVFLGQIGRAVQDDHLPLNNGGIPAIDIIDFDYPYWHTANDLPEHCSAESLAQVGRVLTAWLTQPMPRKR